MAVGVEVTTGARSGPSAAGRAISGQVFVAGLAERGVTDQAILLFGMADYEDYLGDRVAYGALYDQLKTYFDEGGVRAYVARVVGADAAVGTLTVADEANPTPVDTLRIDAASAGAWSSRLRVLIRDGALASTFRITVTLDGVAVEDKTNLASPAAAVVAFATSAYVRVTDLGSPTAAPANRPANIVATPLTAGDDDRANVATNDYVAALDMFSPGLLDGAVAIPGLGAAVHAGLIAHAEANNRVALLSGALTDDTVEELVALAGTQTSDSAGLFAPWLNVDDGAGGFRQISPEGYVAACRARAHNTVGAWRAPAGAIAKATTILGLAQTYSKEEGNALDSGRVSVVRQIGDGFRLYGWRSLSIDEDNFYFLSARDVLNRLTKSGEAALEEYVFAPIDAKGQVLSAVNAALVGIVEPMRAAGGLFENIDPTTGQSLDPGYRVDTGASVNSVASLADNKIKARMSVRVSPTGALVQLTIVKVGVTSGL